MVEQIYYEFYSKPMKPRLVISADSALPWQQKRTVLTQECIRRLLNTKKELNCTKKQGILNIFMQDLKNYGYCSKFRGEILNAGIHGYNKILEADRAGERPLYRRKGWNRAARWMEVQKRKKTWLGDYKLCIFVPPTPNSELKKALQAKEREMRVGGREKFPIKIIETAGKSLERELVLTDQFNGNSCTDKSCLPSKNDNNKIGCRQNNVGYQIPCQICQRAGKSVVYFGETGCNMHKRMKEHFTKFRSKKRDIRESSAFIKHIENEHNGLKGNESFESYFPKVNIVKAYKKVLNGSIEEGTFMINHDGEALNSKTEWNQPRIIQTTIIQGGAEIVGGQVLPFHRDGGGAPPQFSPSVGERAGDQSTAGQQGRGGEGARAGDQMTDRARRLQGRTSG